MLKDRLATSFERVTLVFGHPISSFCADSRVSLCWPSVASTVSQCLTANKWAIGIGLGKSVVVCGIGYKTIIEAFEIER